MKCLGNFRFRQNSYLFLYKMRTRGAERRTFRGTGRHHESHSSISDLGRRSQAAEEDLQDADTVATAVLDTYSTVI